MNKRAIETLSLVLLLALLHLLPEFKSLSTNLMRFRDLLVAGSFGAIITTLMIIVSQLNVGNTLTDFFAKYSYLKAHGHNVVNVIIVDFRGFDTMGEITVLAIAGMGIYALLKLKPKKSKKA